MSTLKDFTMASAPLRLGLAGGGTDLPGWCERHAGAVVNVALAHRVYVLVKRRWEGGVRVSYSRTEVVDRVADLEHDLIRAALLAHGVEGDVEVVTVSDVPGRGTGLGSSAALLVALLRALHEQAPESMELVAEAREVKRAAGHSGGWQDLLASTLGGMRIYSFDRGLPAYNDDLRDEEGLFFLGQCLSLHLLPERRQERDVLREQQTAVEAQAEVFHDLVRQAHKLRCSWQGLRDWTAVGTALREGWELKRRLPGATTPELDALVERALAAGAGGAKVCGAGGGGFLLTYAEPKARPAVRAALAGLRELPVRFSVEGVRVEWER